MDKEIVQITAAHCFIIKSYFLFFFICNYSSPLYGVRGIVQTYSIIKLYLFSTNKNLSW